MVLAFFVSLAGGVAGSAVSFALLARWYGQEGAGIWMLAAALALAGGLAAWGAFARGSRKAFWLGLPLLGLFSLALVAGALSSAASHALAEEPADEARFLLAGAGGFIGLCWALAAGGGALLWMAPLGAAEGPAAASPRSPGGDGPP